MNVSLRTSSRILRRHRDARLVLSAGEHWVHPGSQRGLPRRRQHGLLDKYKARRLIRTLVVDDIGLLTGIPQSWRFDHDHIRVVEKEHE
jgi:hypothetical protein